MKKINRTIKLSIGLAFIVFLIGAAWSVVAILRPVDIRPTVLAGHFPIPNETTQKEMAIKLFHLVNKTGAKVEVQALADGEELFVKRMEANLKPSPEIVHSENESYPTLDLKISINRQSKQLTVREPLYLKKSQQLAISASPEKAGAGFQIILNRDGIVVTQDYYPAR